MKKIVLLSGDDKLLHDMQQWLGDIAEEITIELISSLEDFQTQYCTEPEEDPTAPATAGSEPQPDNGVKILDDANAAIDVVPGATAQVGDVDDIGEKAERHFPARLVIADLEVVDGEPLEWLKQTKEAMVQYGHSVPEAPARFVLLGYSEKPTNIDKFRDDAVDDLMLKPLDKSVFLQKVELYLGEAGDSVRPTFLFKQKTETVIEMGKDTTVESLSEFGFSMKNPAPLAAGVFAKVYSEVFGTGLRAALIGRVYNSERNNESGAYSCFLSFHGIAAEQLATVRKFVRNEKVPASKQKRMGLHYDAPIKSIAIVDLNGQARSNIREVIESHFANAQILEFPSYSSFLRYCSKRFPDTNVAVQSVDENAAEIKKAEKTLGGGTDITFNINATTGDIMSIDPMPKKGVEILGFDAGELKARPNMWLDAFDSTGKEIIAEYLLYLRSGQSGNVYAIANTKVGQVRLRLQGKIIRAAEGTEEGVAALDLKEMTEQQWEEAHKQTADSHEIGVLDALFLDGSFLAENPASGIEGLYEILRRSELVPNRDNFSLTILADERSRLSPAEFRLKGVHDFIYKPLDRKMLSAKLAIHIRDLQQKGDAIDLHFRKAGKPGRVTKEVLMEEVSEFGLQIRHATSFKTNSFLRFFSPILDESGNGVLARCLTSTKNAETGEFHCFFGFFGATDAQLKHIRKWIRGDYAAKKEKSGS